MSSIDRKSRTETSVNRKMFHSYCGTTFTKKNFQAFQWKFLFNSHLEAHLNNSDPLVLMRCVGKPGCSNNRSWTKISKQLEIGHKKKQKQRALCTTQWDGLKVQEPEVAQVGRIETNERKKGGKQNTRLFCRKGKERSLFWSCYNAFFMHSEAAINCEAHNKQLRPGEVVRK